MKKKEQQSYINYFVIAVNMVDRYSTIIFLYTYADMTK